MQDGLWRYEFKYIVPRHVRGPLTADLRAFVRPDPHGDPRGFYSVRSLYLDSSDWRCVLDKSAGLPRRQKLRIRTYPNSGEFAPIKFEVKFRINNQILKRVATVDRSDYDSLLSGLHARRMVEGAQLRSNPSLRPFFYVKQLRGMAPVINVEFRRQAFTARHDRLIRVTLDDSLIACRARSLFEPIHRARRLTLGAGCVLELKVARTLPLWLSRLTAKYRLRLQSVSKYNRAAELGMRGLARLF